ncbi:uncharacterized protein PRCAT00001087001 [Priceomyces carsonii]|uniref:uncharacterized protein n=1 Tax=Priceomyces carsonii TaxID=28549 RepID=UPI002ED810EF|nr:unnamed protein product [Priceomyces carsonii]
MEKLTAFQLNNPRKLYLLAKKLDERRYFEVFLHDSQAKVLHYILSASSYDIWYNFLEGNCVLKYFKNEDIDLEDAVEEGNQAIKMLALHIRYLLWEKAVDYYYNSDSLDGYYIEEVSDDYELIDQLDDLSDDRKENSEQKIIETTSQAVREEEENYDDDDDDDDEEEEGEESHLKQQNVPASEGKQDNTEIKYTEENQVILEIPTSIFKSESELHVNQVSRTDFEQPNNEVAMNDQEALIKEFNKVYHSFEYDRETLIKRRKLEKSDMKLEESQTITEKDADSSSNNMSINLGPASTSLQHLLETIQQNRDEISLNDFELRNLFMDVRKSRGKWASDERVGQEALYEACEKVVMELRGYTEHSTPFLNKVSKREAPNYGLIIKKPMDLNTVMKKLRGLSYNSKKEFVDDLMLIWSNCLTYNADPKHFLRAHAIAMQKKTIKLIPKIPDVTIKNRTELEKEEENGELESRNDSPDPVSGKSYKKGRKRAKEQDQVVKSEPEEPSETPEPVQSAVGSKTIQSTLAADSAAVDQIEEDEDDDEDNNDAADNDEEEEEEEFDPELQAWKTLTAKSRAEYCAQRSQLFDASSKLNMSAPAILRGSRAMNNFSHYLANQEVVPKSGNLIEGEEPYLLEHDITGGVPGLLYRGVEEDEEDRREQKLIDFDLGQLRRKHSSFVLPTDSGLNKLYFENITEIQEIRRICFKISLIRQMQTQQFVHHTQMKQPEIEPIKEVDVDPISRLANHDPFTQEVQYSVLRRNVSKIAMQTGFECTEPVAINTLTQIAERFMSNLIKSLKLHSESSSSNRLTSRQILLLSLLENGIQKPDDLYTFVSERIVKQQEKLKALRTNLSNFLKDLLRPGLETFKENNFEDNSEQFVTGDFSNDIGDDYFGFKELGLDKEFKLLSSSIPINLLHSRLQNSYTNSDSVTRQQRYEDLIEFEVPRLTAADIDNQIGLLKSFYQKLLEKSKTLFIKNQKKKGESTELPDPNLLLLIEDEELPQKQRNIRPRLPPTGKIASVKKRTIAGSFFLPDDEGLIDQTHKGESAMV